MLASVIMDEISQAQKGSDLYGLTEKVAYHLHIQNPFSSSDVNWFHAQYQVSVWAQVECIRDDKFKTSLSDYVTTVVSRFANTKSKGRELDDLRLSFDDSDVEQVDYSKTPFDDWVEAQDDLANNVLFVSSRESQRRAA